MSLRVLHRFHTQADAQVAASLLRSAGLRPILFDEHYGGVDWVAQSALGGYRLMLPAAEIEDGLALLAGGVVDDLPEADPCPDPGASAPATVATLILLALVSPEVGWLASGLRKRQWPDSRTLWLGVPLAMVLSAALVPGVVLAILLVRALLFNPP